MKQLDLLLINPGGRRGTYQSLATEATAVEPPIWCGLLAEFARRKGFGAEILDANAEGLSDAEVARRVDMRNPRLVTVVCYGQNPNASTQTMPAAYALIKAIKGHHPGHKVLMVGGHVAALPERTLLESGADYCATGEGACTILDLLQVRSIKAAGLRGCYYWADVGYGHQVVSTPPAPNVQDLDGEMPPAYWDLLPDLGKYRCHEWHGWTSPDGKRLPYASLYTSIGCPFACTFCCIQAPFKEGDGLAKLDMVGNDKRKGNSYRRWSPALIAEQIAKLHYDHGVSNIKIADEMFVLNREHVLGVCNAVQGRITAPGDRLNIWCYGRVDTCNDEKLLAKMRSTGFRWIALGIESASESVRDGVDKGYAQGKIARCVERVRQAGMHVGANYIFGLPGESLEDMQDTYDLACALNTPYANFYTCFPAGTPVWTPSGFKAIELLQVGDKVYGKNGETTVKRTMNRVADDLIIVKPRYLPSFRCTSEHPMYVAVISRDAHSNKATFRRFEWIKAEDLKPFDPQDKMGEYHAATINRNSFRREQTQLDMSRYVVGHLGAGKKGGQLNKVGQRYLKPWDVDEDLAELFGWYVAEGSLASRKNKQICFSLHVEEREHHVRIQYLLAKCFRLRSRVLPAGPNCVKITFTSKVWLRAVHDLFGATCQTKKVPDCIMNASDNVCKAFLRGYQNGDGTSHPNALGQHKISTASEQLSRQLMMLFLKVGIVPSCARSEPWVGVVAGRSAVRSGSQYSLSWMNDPEGRKEHRRFLKTDDWYFIPFKSVERQYGEETVYNVATVDETYAIPCVTHNCMAYPGSQLWNAYPEVHNRSWEQFSQFGYDSTPMIPEPSIVDFCNTAWQSYYKRPEYKHMMERTFGPKIAAEASKVGRPLKFKLLEERNVGALAATSAS